MEDKNVAWLSHPTDYSAPYLQLPSPPEYKSVKEKVNLILVAQL